MRSGLVNFRSQAIAEQSVGRARFFSHLHTSITMKHDLCPRSQVAALHRAGHSVREVADIVQKDKSFVERWWNRTDIVSRHGGGKPRVLTRALIDKVRKKLTSKERTSTRIVARAMKISQTVVVKAAHLSGLFPYHRWRKLILSKKDVSARMAWAKRHQNEHWDRVMFTDEKIVFCVPRPNSKNDIIWADKGTKVLPAPYDRHSAKLNVSASIWLDGRSEVHIFSENLTGLLYKDILTRTILPAANNMPAGGFKLLLDNDPKHKSHLVRDFLHENNVAVLYPPPRSPDVNCIENVWPLLIDELHKLGHQTAASLRGSIKKAWAKISQESIRNCVLSMTKRCRLVVEAKGHHIKY